MASFNKFNQFVEDLAHKVHNLGSDTLKLALSNTAPNATDATLSDITQIAAGNGYTTGGFTLTVSASAQSGGTYKLTIDDITITASGGAIATFRYFILLNDTPTSPADPLIGWWDYGSAVDLGDGQSLPVDFSATNGVLQVA